MLEANGEQNHFLKVVSVCFFYLMNRPFVLPILFVQPVLLPLMTDVSQSSACNSASIFELGCCNQCR